MAELNLILIGPPGAGKGTQAERLIDDFDLPYYATGNILRAAIEGDTELGREAKEYVDRGELVPDDLICRVIDERLDSGEADDGFILDGFPRTVGQAEMLDETLTRRGRSLTAALLVDAPDEEVVRRLSGRRICVEEQPRLPRGVRSPEERGRVRPGRLPPDPARRRQAGDDQRSGSAVYHEQTEPLIEWYEEQGLLRRFDGTRTPRKSTATSVPHWPRWRSRPRSRHA